ncbi:MAG: adenylosuccinate synthase [Desulforegulaceae bacterium]|nr:adenylosuccinate synthase [Desulforegulaceae bacterium]
MSSIAVIGTQWGDEGKGKIVDLLSDRADYVVRFQGGNNAGHTMVIDGESIISHLVPSGIIQGKKCMIGNGVVVDPSVLLGEMEYLKGKGIDVSPEKLLISEKAHVIFPYHKMLDNAREASAGANKIGTTGRGIGPCYEDKASRNGIRFAEFLEDDIFKSMLKINVEEKSKVLSKVFSHNEIPDFDEIYKTYSEFAKKLRPHIANISAKLNKALTNNSKILFEGAQGTHLDIDHGTYPFVTSSNTISGNIACGSGVGPKAIQEVLGIVKAYTTRVGAGPFPTELLDETGRFIQKKGAEFGATTGRERRCGWLDTVILNNAVQLNSLTGLVLTKLDVLGGIKQLKICTSYKIGNEITSYFPALVQNTAKAVPQYEALEGWEEDLTKVRRFEDFPENTIKYIRRIEEISETEVKIASVGPGREETIEIKPLFR